MTWLGMEGSFNIKIIPLSFTRVLLSNLVGIAQIGEIALLSNMFGIEHK